MSAHKLWVEFDGGQIEPAKRATLMVYAKPMQIIPNGPAGDAETMIPLDDLIAAYNSVHGTDYSNY